MGLSEGQLRPGEFSAYLLRAMEASEGRRRRRKRDTRPDALGMQIKQELLARAVADDPAPEMFEAWLLDQVLTMPAGGGPVRALCIHILDEYEVACHDPRFRAWLEEGAPSDDRVSEERAAPRCDVG